MVLFINKSFIAHAGSELPFKIECDPPVDVDIETAVIETMETFASIIGNGLEFGDVYGIPRGGDRLAKVLKKYCKPDGPLLIVDDVFTSGISMEEAKQQKGEDSIGAVIFSRSPCPPWVHAIFQLSEWARP